MRVREATAEDWPAVAALLAELGRPPALGTPEEGELRRVFLAYLERDDVVALVAEDGDRVVGFCDLELRTRLNFAEPQAWIPDLVVAEDARSRGAGRALLERAGEIARERGAWGMSLESATWRERAHAFYEREGWTDSGKAFTKPLTDRPWPPPPASG
ncbi:MAG TPA: GNAT family N-acetyltransferase [Actinomycetota bacterium]|nr:GNAT family N-acetyltransferase [Actinomycetota bacterium]